MIRKFEETDIEVIAKIWLDTNVEAHNFIDAEYWQKHLEVVKDMLLQAEIYVYEEEKKEKILGFIGLTDDYVAGIFVCNDNQSNGIGKQLLDFVKRIKTQLFLSVYGKNTRALNFYQRESFKIQSKNIDKNTGQEEYRMMWKQ